MRRAGWASRSGVAPGLAVAVLALAASCKDIASPTTPRGVALNVVPVFGAGHVDALSGDVDSFVVRISNPPAPDTTFSVRIPAGQDSIRLVLSVLINGAVDTLGVQFDGYSSSSGLLLYSGTSNVVVRAGVPSPQTPVDVSYVGPGKALGALVITPRSVAVQPRATVQFGYSARDTNGVAMAPDSVPVRYISRDPAVMIVGVSGLAQALADGQTWVVAQSLALGSVRDSARVTVSASPPPLIGLSSTAAAVRDTAGTSSPAPVVISVVNAGGQTLSGLVVGTITYGAGATGWLTAQLANTTAPTSLSLVLNNAGLGQGVYTAAVPVTAPGVANSPQVVTVTFTVAAPGVASLALAPGFLVARPGDTLTLAATARDAAGGIVAAPNLSFLSRAPSVVSVGATTGTITALAGGTAVIVATAGGTTVTDSILVAVADNGVAIVSAVAGGAFTTARVGDTVRVRVAVGLRGVLPELLGSYNAALTWNPAVLQYVSAAAVPGGFAGPVINPIGAIGGVLQFGAADAAGVGTPSTDLLEIVFVANAAGSTTLSALLTDLSAAVTFTNLLPAALYVGGTVVVQ